MKSPTGVSELNRQILALRRESRASRGSTGVIEMVEDALGGAVVTVPPSSCSGNGGSAGRDARYRKCPEALKRSLITSSCEYHFFPSA
jgi:hypothetical protein